MNPATITCDKCHQGTMEPKTIARFGGFAQVIGLAVWIPAAGVLGIATVFVLLGAFSTGIAPDDPTTGAAGAAAVSMFGGCGLTALYLFLFPVLAVGFVLALDKKVWRCPSCGYVYDRA